jgi:hypothetical protein
MSKYDQLSEHLLTVKGDAVTMTFAQVGKLVDELPKSALLHRAWWSNETDIHGHVQARAWLRSGFSAEPDMRSKTVVFRRT